MGSATEARTIDADAACCSTNLEFPLHFDDAAVAEAPATLVALLAELAVHHGPAQDAHL